MMAVDMGETDVGWGDAERGEDAKFDVVIGKLGAIGLERGVFDAGTNSFDQRFAIGNPFELE